MCTFALLINLFESLINSTEFYKINTINVHMKNVCLLFHNMLLKQIYAKKKKKHMEYVEHKYTWLKHFSKKRKKNCYQFCIKIFRNFLSINSSNNSKRNIHGYYNKTTILFFKFQSNFHQLPNDSIFLLKKKKKNNHWKLIGNILTIPRDIYIYEMNTRLEVRKIVYRR